MAAVATPRAGWVGLQTPDVTVDIGSDSPHADDDGIRLSESVVVRG